MAKKVIVSNTTGSYYELCYRMPGEVKQILKIDILAYALNQELTFPSDVYYNEFKKQNEHYFTGNTPVLVEGKQFSGKLEKLNEKINQEVREKIETEITKVDERIADVSSKYTKRPVGIKVGEGAQEDFDRVESIAGKGRGKGKGKNK